MNLIPSIIRQGRSSWSIQIQKELEFHYADLFSTTGNGKFYDLSLTEMEDGKLVLAYVLKDSSGKYNLKILLYLCMIVLALHITISRQHRLCLSIRRPFAGQEPDIW